MTALVSGLYAGHVMHHRLRPRRHHLRYRMFWLLLDLDEIDAIAGRCPLFSRNGFNLLSFYDRDHLDGSQRTLRDQIEEHLAAAGLDVAGGPIRLATLPRLLGHVFNPLSVYFCHGRDGALRAMLYEVNNTFGERHSYLIPVRDGAASPILQRCDKRFYVSPFMDMELSYAFRVTPPGEALGVAVRAEDRDGLLLATSFSGKRREIGTASLLGAVIKHPFLTLKVVAGIHWEAVWLWLKGVRLTPRPLPPARPVTIVSAAYEDRPWSEMEATE